MSSTASFAAATVSKTNHLRVGFAFGFRSRCAYRLYCARAGRLTCWRPDGQPCASVSAERANGFSDSKTAGDFILAGPATPLAACPASFTGGLVRGAWLIRQYHPEARHRIPVRVSCSGLECVAGGGDDLAIFVDHLCVGQLVLLSVSVLHVANCSLGLAHIIGNAFVALGANADRPINRGCGANLQGSPQRGNMQS